MTTRPCKKCEGTGQDDKGQCPKCHGWGILWKKTGSKDA